MSLLKNRHYLLSQRSDSKQHVRNKQHIIVNIIFNDYEMNSSDTPEQSEWKRTVNV